LTYDYLEHVAVAVELATRGGIGGPVFWIIIASAAAV
jgi:hypothetical protein